MVTPLKVNPAETRLWYRNTSPSGGRLNACSAYSSAYETLRLLQAETKRQQLLSLEFSWTTYHRVQPSRASTYDPRLSPTR